MINGERFIQLAGKFCVLSDADESNYRVAISRAYYGAFHLVRDFLDEIGVVDPQNLNSHNFAQRVLIQSGNSAAFSGGNTLRDLHSYRIAADYERHDVRFESPDFARRTIELAHRLKSILDACRNEPARTEIQTGIADYQSRLP